jgi:hypothetical protein
MIETKGMMDVVTKHFGEGAHKYRTARGWDKYEAKTYPVYVTAKQSPDGSFMVMFGFKDLGSLLHFTVAQYPACCGIRMFHSFRVSEDLTQEFVDDFMNAFIAAASVSQSSLGASKRIEVIMVEYGKYLNLYAEGLKAYFDATRECPITEKPNIQYQQLWNYFHKHAKLVRTRLQMNSNSGNILHNMEVIFA